MAITRYAGDRFTIAAGDTKPTGVLDGGYLIDTGNLTQFVKRTVAGASEWTQLAGGGGGGGTPGGSNTQVQFNNAGAFAGNANLTFDGSKLAVNDLALSGIIYDSNNSIGNGGMVLTNEGTTGVNWKSIESVLSGVGGSGVANYVARWSDEDTLTSGTIFDNGDVGIGTANPGGKLHVFDTVVSDMVILESSGPSAADGPDVVFYRNSASPADNDDLGKLVFRGRNDNSQDVNYANIIAEAIDVSDGTEDGALKFYTYLTGANTETMVLRSANVGIGTATPAVPLHITKSAVGDNEIPEVIRLSTLNSASPNWSTTDGLCIGAEMKKANGTTITKQPIRFRYDGGNMATTFEAGNVGIGTDQPLNLLMINGSSPIIRFRDSNASGTPLAYIDASDGALKLQADASDETASSFLTLEVDGSEHVRVIADGNIGIGLTDPDAKLEIKGTGGSTGLAFKTTDSSSNNTFWIQDGGKAGLHYFPFVINQDNSDTDCPASTFFYVHHATAPFIIKNDGKVGVGTDAPATKLHVEDSTANTTATKITVQGGSRGFTLGKAHTADNYQHLKPITDTAMALRVMPTGTTAREAYVEVWNKDFENAANSTSWNRGMFYVDTSNDVYLRADGYGTGSVYIGTENSTKALTVKDGGNIGIGDNLINPQHRLHVSGDAIISGYLYDSTNSTGADGYVLTSKEDGPQWKLVEDVLSGVGGSGTANYVSKWVDSDTIGNSIIYDDGDVGISTASPDAKLHVFDTTVSDLAIFETNNPNSSNGPDVVLYRSSASPADADDLGRIAFRGKNDADQDINYANIIGEAIDVSDGTEDGALRFNTYLTGASTETMVLRSANVGIGTNAPAGKLEIVGSNGTVAGTPDGDAEELVIRNNDRAGIQILSANNGYGSLIFGSASDINGANIFYAPASTLLTIGTQVAAGEIALRVANGAEAVRIDADGSVGIGTDAPADHLQVKGSGSQSLRLTSTSSHASIRVDRYNTSSDANFIIQTGGVNKWRLATGLGGNDEKLTIYDDIADVNMMSFKTAVGVGVGPNFGTNEPTAALHVLGDTLRLERTDNAPALKLYNNHSSPADGAALGYVQFTGKDNDGTANMVYSEVRGGVGYNTDTAVSGYLAFLTTNNGTSVAERMRIKYDGNVGIGTDDPRNKLTITDGATSYTNANVLLQIKRNATNGNDDTSRAAIMLANNSNGFFIAYGGTTDRLRFLDGGAVERITLLNGGNVGIGEIAPEGLLSFKADESNTPKIRFQNQHSVTTDAAISTYDDASGTTVLIGSNLYINSSGSTTRFNTGEESAGFRADRGGLLQFYTGETGATATERIRVIADGNVGIGTDAPSGKLHILQSGTYSSTGVSDAALHIKATQNYPMNIVLDADGSSDDTNRIRFLKAGTTKWQLNVADDVDFFYYNGSSWLNRFVIEDGGNVGIGTATPGTILHLKQNDAVGPTISLTNNSKTSYINLWGATGGGTDRTNQFEINAVNTGYGLTLASTDYVRFKTNGIAASDEAMRINADGNVGIGTNAPAAKLDIWGGTGARPTDPFAGQNQLFISQGGTSNAGITISADNNAGTQICTFIQSNTSASAALIGTQSNHGARIRTNNTDRITIASGGAITFNNAFTFPTADGSANQMLKTDGSGNLSWTSAGTGTVTGSGTDHYVPRWNGTTALQDSAIISLDSGSVGIGTNAPNAKLDISDATHDNLRIGTRGGNMNLFSVTDAGAGAPLAFEGTQFHFITGSVGIGTNNPSKIFEVYHSENRPVLIKSAGSYNSFIEMDSNRSGADSYTGGIVGKWDGTETASIYFRTGSDTTNKDDGYITFQTAPAGTVSERMRITSSGLVGIGTGTPVYTLQGNGTNGGIIGVTRTSGNTTGTLGHVRFGNTNIDSDLANIKGVQDGATDSARLEFQTQATGAAAATHMTIKSDGKIGIGTNAPAEILEVVSDSDPTILIRPVTVDSANSGKISYRENAGGTTGVDLRYDGANNKFIIDTSDVTNALVIKRTDGKVGIGTATPYRNTHIYQAADSDNFEGALQTGGTSAALGGYFGYNSTSSGRLTISSLNNAGGANAKIFLGFGLDGDGSPATEVMILTQGGSVGIGTNAPSSLLHVRSANELNATFESSDSGSRILVKDDDTNTYINAADNVASIGQNVGLNASNLNILSNGSVGIGTITPNDDLNIHDTSASANLGIKITRGTQTHGLRIGVNDSHAFVWTDQSQSLAFATNNTERLTILSGGSVGIGTNSPDSKLEIAGGGYNSSLKIKGSGADTGIQFEDSGGTTDGYIYANSDRIGFLDKGADWTIECKNDDYIRFATNGNTEHMRIKSDGNVGIGTDNPTLPLQVSDTGFGQLRLTRDATDDRHWDFLVATNGYLSIRPNNTINTSNEYITIRDNGNNEKIRLATADDSFFVGGSVGIGTNAPVTLLDVYHATHSQITASAPAGHDSSLSLIEQSTSAPFGSASVYGFQWKYDGGDNKLYLSSGVDTNVVNRLTVQRDDGNVGIGTITPADTLHVYGTGTTAIFESSSANSYISIKEASGGNHVYLGNQNGLFVIQTPGSSYSTKFQVKSDGNVGVGVSPAYKFQVGGDIYMNGGNFLMDHNYEIRSKDSGGTTRTIVRVNSNVLQYGWSGSGNVLFMGGGSYTERMRINASGGAITFNNAFTFPTADGSANQMLKTDGSGNLSWTSAGTGTVTGSGTASYVPKFTSSTAIGNSALFDGGGNNIGIGTNNPQGQLQLHSTASAVQRLVFSNTNSNLNPQQRIEFWESAATSTSTNAHAAIEYVGSTAYESSDGTLLVKGYGSSADLAIAGFNRNGNVYLAMSGNKKVGINTTTPSTMLHVHSGDILITSGKQLISTNSYTQAPPAMLTTQGPSTGATSLGTGTWGIMMGPQHTRSTVANTYYPGIAFNHLLNNGGAVTYNNHPQAWIGTRLHDTPGSERAFLVFSTKGGTGVTASDVPSERMCIDPVDGFVGIGTTNPQVLLDVYTSDDDIARFETTSTDHGRISIRSGSSGDAQIRFQNAAASKWSIGNDGGDSNKFKIAVGSGAFAASEAVIVDTSGNLSILGTLTEASSLALKENIEDFTPSLDIINKIRPVKYNKKKESKKEIGLIAEELAELFPELVDRDNQGNPSGVNYSRAVTVLLGGFKELYKEIEELKKRI